MPLKFCCDHDGWDGYVPARRRDADPFNVNNIPEIAYVHVIILIFV